MSGNSCPFCAIIAGTMPGTVTLEWPDVVALVPLNPVTLGHTLIVPKRHVRDAIQDPEVSAAIMRRACMYAAAGECDSNIITSIGPAATQTVMHLHLHVVPRHAGDGLSLPWTGQVAL